MKAWAVSGADYEYSYLVFAESPSQARAIGYGLDGLCEGDYVDLRARRVPGADRYCEEIGTVAEWENVEHARILRSIGWYGTEYPKYCDICGLAEFDPNMIPESKITEKEDTMICRGCLDGKGADDE